MARAGIRPDVAERVLGHAIPGVEGVYDRHPYDLEKADALSRLVADRDHWQPEQVVQGRASAALGRVLSRETDHEEARYAWNYRRCRITDCGALFAAMVAR
jgi:hypothetical protein